MAKRGRPKKVQLPRSTPPKGPAVGDVELKEGKAGDALAVVSLIESDLIDAEVIQGSEALIVGKCCREIAIEEEPAWGDRSEGPRSPYLRAVKNGLGVECDQHPPNPLASNRDTKQGLQLSNEEEKDTDLVFTLEDVASEREFWASALIRIGRSGPPMAWKKKLPPSGGSIDNMKRKAQGSLVQTKSCEGKAEDRIAKRSSIDVEGWQEVVNKRHGKQVDAYHKTKVHLAIRD
ncbi:hypothetical protein Dimus_007178 [Dionaea muscipula]